MHTTPRSPSLLVGALACLTLTLLGCGGGGGGGGAAANWIYLSRLYRDTAASKTFRETPPGDASGDYDEIIATLPTPCSPAGTVNLVATHILDRQYADGRHERLYVNIDAGGISVSLKGMWISAAGGTGDFVVFDPPASFPNMMFENVPYQRTGQVRTQAGGSPVAFAGNECADFSAGPVTGPYDYIFTYAGVGSVTVPAGTWTNNAYEIVRNEVRPGSTRTRSTFLAGGLGEVYWEETGLSGALQSYTP